MSKKFRFGLEECRTAFEAWFAANAKRAWSTSAAFKLPVATNDNRAKLKMTGKAWAKMMILILNYDSEVAWHGLVERDAGEIATFTITDILLYPQEVTGSTVTTDQQEYQDWMFSLSDEQLTSMRFQGHSHVNMPVTPSSTDEDHEEGIVSMLKESKGDFYIFGIFNKKGDKTLRIFDTVTNTYYETKDIDFSIIADDIGELREDMDDMVKRKTVYYGSYSGGYSGYSTATGGKTTTVTATGAAAPKTTVPAKATPTVTSPTKTTVAASDQSKDLPMGYREDDYEGWPYGWY